MSTDNRTYLIVSYAEKDAAKAAGARWDPQRKQWYYSGAALPLALQRFDAKGRRRYICPSCGETGYSGQPPFSTCPPLCDDCN